MTVGERAEDVFYVTDESGGPLSTEARCTAAQRTHRNPRPPRMNPRSSKLQPYPFERLRALLAGAQPPADSPAHSAVRSASRGTRRRHSRSSADAQHGWLRQLSAHDRHCRSCAVSIANWLTRRFQLPQGIDLAGDDGAAGEWHARSPVRIRAGAPSIASKQAAAGDAQSVLSDL